MELKRSDLGKYSPFNDQYHQEVNGLKQTIAELTSQMKPKHVEVVKLRHAGQSRAETCEELGITPQRYHLILKREDSKHLLTLLSLMRQTIDGPNKEQRFHMLWRICVDNELKAPRTAIAAIAEMNKMAGVKGEGSGGITVIVQNNVLNAGALDT